MQMVEASRLDTEVQFLKGVGPKWVIPMGKVGLRTVRDVLYYFPRRYDDRRNLPPIKTIKPGDLVTVRGHIKRVDSRPIRGGRVIIRAILTDGPGQVGLTWFNQPWMLKKLRDYPGELVAFGKVVPTPTGLEISSPEIEFIDDDDDAENFARITPVYPLTEGLPQTIIRKAAGSALDFYLDAVDEPFPSPMQSKLKLRPLRWALSNIHQPADPAAKDEARKRLVFEEFFYMQLAVQLRRRETKQEVGIQFDLSGLPGKHAASVSLFAENTDDGDLWSEVHKMLPFELTGAQRRVIGEIWRDMERPTPMNRLVQGDVGSGKTAVAACAMLAAVRCGFQAAMMAPTEILAEQHFLNLRRLFDPLGIHVVMLHGKMPAAQRKKATMQSANGEARILVGTHSLIQESVDFQNLGLAVIDEQHRFGVMQRAALRLKGKALPDVLVMTATPIPRTLTMTLYGDLDVSVIDELPPGRKSIKTHWKRPGERDQVYEAIRQLLQEGRQAYFVCPMISESEKMQTQAAEDYHETLKTEVFPEYRVELLHGQMKSQEKDEIMTRFRKHEADILVSTVVIEVGVDVPNASVMVIEDANRFGLAQLHQLRGRVGRGQHQSYCILVSDARTEESIIRLQTIRDTTDGFQIAEADWNIRGPGDVAGTRQSGDLDFKLADLLQDTALLEFARQAAIDLLEKDPDLTRPEHQTILARVREKRMDKSVATIS